MKSINLSFGQWMENYQLLVLAFKTALWCIHWRGMLQVISLTAVSFPTLLNVSEEDKRPWFGQSPGLVFFSPSTSFTGVGLTGLLIVVRDVCRPDWENTFHIKVVALQIFLCVCVRAVNSTAFLPSFRAACVIFVRKVARVTPTFVGCACCADRSEHLPRRRSVFGTSLSSEIPVLHRGGKRQERAEIV